MSAVSKMPPRQEDQDPEKNKRLYMYNRSIMVKISLGCLIPQNSVIGKGVYTSFKVKELEINQLKSEMIEYFLKWCTCLDYFPLDFLSLIVRIHWNSSSTVLHYGVSNRKSVKDRNKMSENKKCVSLEGTRRNFCKRPLNFKLKI